jgi:hypothetical protein
LIFISESITHLSFSLKNTESIVYIEQKRLSGSLETVFGSCLPVLAKLILSANQHIPFPVLLWFEKIQIIGLSDDEEEKHLAFTKSFIKKEGVVNTSVGNKRIVLAYYPEFETIAAFDRMVDGAEVEVTEIDFYGQTPENGKLERVFIYNSVL